VDDHLASRTRRRPTGGRDSRQEENESDCEATCTHATRS
jgi:hypothetical protein